MKMMNRLLVGSLTTIVLLSLPTMGLTQVTSPDEICAPTDDPCTISSSVVVQNGAVLDFGSRELHVTGGGTIDTLNGTVVVRCGKFVADVGTNVALKVRGPNGQGGIDGGVLTLEATRNCSGNSTYACFDDAGCKFGTCTVHACSGDPLLRCSTDSSCQVGPCNQLDHRCTGRRTRTCTTNAECDLGTCLVDDFLCSSNLTRACSIDADCDVGLCNVGDGSIFLDGRVRAEGQAPGAVFITASTDLTTTQNFTLGATSAQEDGGILELEARTGSLLVSGGFDGSGGSDSQGGDFSFLAGQDVTINGNVNVNGGDFDGGFLEIDSGRDITIGGNLLANAVSGEGFGGEIAVFAGRDVTFAGILDVQANGHQSADNFCGEAGPIEIDAGGGILIGPDVSMQSNGPAPDCAGEGVSLTAGGDIEVSGKFQSKGQGRDGDGGLMDVAAGGAVDFTATSSIDVSGGSGGTGSLEIVSGGDVTFAGAVTAAASNNGSADSIIMDSGNDMFLTGTLSLSGSVPAGAINGIVDLAACRLTVQGGASILNGGSNGRNFLTGRETVNVQSGALVQADGLTGTNTVIYRDVAKPPVLSGTITPAAVTQVNAGLKGCPICANGVIEQGETCDDGNTTGGDGCSADCQDEGCVAQTPDYPNVPLCDDAMGCTVDACNAETHTCTHVFDCDDGISCTEDGCGQDGNCQNVANNGLCDDSNPCTTDICNPNTDCINTNNSNACNDGVACTVGDVCSQGVCAGTENCPDGQVCSINSGQCVIEGTLCGNGAIDQGETCDDGNATWAPGQYCSATCSALTCGDPDNSGTVNASDALFVLRVAVNISACDPCVCNVDNAGTPPVSASDALRVLRRAVNIPGALVCPACPA